MPDNSNSSNSDGSPSYHRRKALRDSDASNMMAIIATYPLDKYFEISNRLLENFQHSLDERKLDETYVYGIRFCTFSVEALPKHPHYNQPKFKQLRSKNSKQVDKVLKTMEIVTQRMDIEETAKIRHRQQLEREQQQEQLRLRQQQQEEEEQERQRLEAEAKEARIKEELAGKEKRQKQQQKQNDLEESAYAKLQAMKNQMMETQKKKESSSSVDKTKQVATPKTKASNEQSSDKTLQQTTTATRTKAKANNTIQKPGATESRDKPITRPEHKPAQSPSKPTKKPTTRNTIAAVATTATTPRPAEPPSTPKRTPATTAEEKTIRLLEDTIQKQEQRLEKVDQIQIPSLLQRAKTCLREGNRKAALECVRKKRKLEHMADTSKGAIFQLETQIFQIETSIEDRHIQEALQAASQAMVGIQQTVGIDAETLQEDLTSLTSTTMSAAVDTMDDVDEEELLQELEQWTTPKKKQPKKKESTKPRHNQHQEELDDVDEMSILSLPQVPLQLSTEATGDEMSIPMTNAEATAAANDQKESSGRARGLLRAVLG